MNVTITKAEKLDYDGVELHEVRVDGELIGTVRKDTTETPVMSGRIRVNTRVRSGWSWRMNRVVAAKLSVRRYAQYSTLVETSRAKAVTKLVEMHALHLARTTESEV